MPHPGRPAPDWPAPDWPAPDWPTRGRRRWRGALAALALLAACDGAAAPGGDAVTRLTVAGGAVTVSAPRGYCVDRAATRNGAGGDFVLFGSCAALAPGPFAPAPRPLAVLSAAVSPARTGAPPLAASFDRLGAFLASDAGRAALSRSGDARAVEVLRAFARDDAFFLLLRDTSAFAGPRVAPVYWRALTEERGHIITLSVLGLRAAPLDPDAGQRVIDAFLGRLRAANRAGN